MDTKHIGGSMENLTERDYFATHSPFTLSEAIELLKIRFKEEEKDQKVFIEDAIRYLAQMNYSYADHMITVKAAKPVEKAEDTAEE